MRPDRLDGPDGESLAKLREVADAVLYEGYVLYPYRASAAKNRSRWQFGVLMPRAYAAIDANEPSSSRTECVLEVPDLRTDGMPTLRVLVRFLHVQRRSVERSDPATGRFAPVPQLGPARAVADPVGRGSDEPADRESDRIRPGADRS